MTHICTVHDLAQDKPVTKVYEGISRQMSGSRFQLEQGESGRFYGKELELACSSLAEYCKDNYGWSTFDHPIRLSLFPQQL